MSLGCRISFKNGEAEVFNEDGTPSELYRDALKEFKDEGRALDVWATAHTQEFEARTGKSGDSVTLKDVFKFSDTLESEDQVLNPSEKLRVKSFMRKSGFKNLSSLYKTMVRIFKRDGVLDVDVNAAVSSGLYTASEINQVDVETVSDELSKIEGQLLVEDLEVVPNNDQFSYRSEDKVSVFGAAEVISEEQVLSELVKSIEDFQNIDEIREKVQELPYEDFVEKFNEDKSFRDRLLERFSTMKRVPVLAIVDGKLTSDNVHHFTTVSNTVLSGASSIDVTANVRFLEDISQEVWDNNPRLVEQVLKEVEVDLANLSVDVVGLSKLLGSKSEVIDLLKSAEKMLESSSVANIAEFSLKHQDLLPVRKGVIKVLPQELQKLTIVKLDSTLTDAELFREHGLIRVSEENLFHKVRRANTTEAYEYLYGKVQDGSLEIPTRFSEEGLVDPLNKVEVLKELSQFVMSRDTGIQSEFQEEISLNQLVFNHPKVSKPDVISKVRGLMNISTDVEYLKTDFVTDFYQYILKEKIKDSEVYQEVLSKFDVNDLDIIATEKGLDITGIEFEQELRDYAKLKKDSSLSDLIKYDYRKVTNEDLKYLNYPETLKEFRGEFELTGPYLITRAGEVAWKRVNGRIYRKAVTDFKNDLFIEIKTPTDKVYNEVEFRFKVDHKESHRVLNEYGNTLPSGGLEVLSNNIIKSGVKNTESVKDVSKALDSNLEVTPLYNKNEKEQIEDQFSCK